MADLHHHILQKKFYSLKLVFYLMPLLASGDTAGNPQYNIKEVWEDASRLSFSEAFDKIETLKTDDRKILFARGVLLLNVQPKTQANIQESIGIFDRLIAQNPDDDTGVSARYFLARIYQIHAFTPDLPKAEKLYRDLFDAHPETFYGQLALVKYSLLYIYSGTSSENLPGRVAELEALGAKLTDGPMIRDFNQVLGDAYQRFKISDEKALEHLLVAEKVGYQRYRARADITMVIAQLAERLGKRSLAIEHYEIFARTFIRDERAFTAQQRLDALRRP